MRHYIAALALAAISVVGCDSSSNDGSIRETERTNRGGLQDVNGITPGQPPQSTVDTTAGGISDRDSTGVDSPTGNGTGTSGAGGATGGSR